MTRRVNTGLLRGRRLAAAYFRYVLKFGFGFGFGFGFSFGLWFVGSLFIFLISCYFLVSFEILDWQR